MSDKMGLLAGPRNTWFAPPGSSGCVPARAKTTAAPEAGIQGWMAKLPSRSMFHLLSAARRAHGGGMGCTIASNGRGSPPRSSSISRSLRVGFIFDAPNDAHIRTSLKF